MTSRELIRQCYTHCVGMWGIQPNEFWSMSLQEYSWLADHYIAEAKRQQQTSGRVTEDEWELLRERHKAKRKGR